MTQEIKACKDCKHHRKGLCGRETYIIPDYMVGQKVQRTRWRDISRERMLFTDGCGREAKYFEPKPSFFQKIQNLFKVKL
jgi:hypothetical protein